MTKACARATLTISWCALTELLIPALVSGGNPLDLEGTVLPRETALLVVSCKAAV